MSRENGFKGSASELALQELDELGQARNALLADTQAFLDSIKAPELAGAIKVLSQILAYIATVYPQFETLMSRFSAQRFKRAEFLRLLLVNHGADSPPKRHSWFYTIMSVQVFMLAEIAVVSVSMISDGQQGAPQAVGFAIVFAFATVLLGLGAGFFGLRAALHMKNAPIQTLDDKRTRTLGWVIFATLISLIGWMIFIASRVRATRGHDHIFTMDEVGFLAGFNDGMVWLIICIAGASAVISVRKGYLIEPIKGLANAQHYAFDAINSDVELFTNDTLDALSGRVEDALDMALEPLATAENVAKERAKNLRELNSAIRAYNQTRDHAKATLNHRYKLEIERYERTTGETFTDKRPLDLKAFDDLYLPLICEADIPDAAQFDTDMQTLRDLLADVSVKHQETSQLIENAFTAFRAEQPALSPVTLPKGV